MRTVLFPKPTMKKNNPRISSTLYEGIRSPARRWARMGIYGGPAELVSVMLCSSVHMTTGLSVPFWRCLRCRCLTSPLLRYGSALASQVWILLVCVAMHSICCYNDQPLVEYLASQISLLHPTRSCTPKSSLSNSTMTCSPGNEDLPSAWLDSLHKCTDQGDMNRSLHNYSTMISMDSIYTYTKHSPASLGFFVLVRFGT